MVPVAQASIAVKQESKGGAMEIGLPEVKSEVFEHEDGMLYIADPWEKDFHRPVVRKRVWATGLCARDCPSLIGQGVRRLTNGTYMTDSGARIRVSGQDDELSERRHLAC